MFVIFKYAGHTQQCAKLIRCQNRRTLFTSIFKKAANKAPIPKPVKDIQVYHGEKREDYFSWMENLADPNLGPYIKAENEFTRKAIRQHRFLHKVVLHEMKRRLYLPNALPPVKTVAKGYEYYSTNTAQGIVYLRRKLGDGRNSSEVMYFKNLFSA
ncbi:hypothetical protein BDF20DRAFT_849990 [Mycotypha africana]|uniref:uncharacterized protein n=1 Tax=Mycotypha africana TaxID=64632 RepID=UPI002301A0C7|nr:uncharacterized protein BDF20DRAFT_849990 [Mycotypha africana]KAI8987392.1 hypothetical protein BDF20DRAFT_849990 [Mycotypha africana]